MLEPYAWKQARTVLRELGDGDVAWLPGAFKATLTTIIQWITV